MARYFARLSSERAEKHQIGNEYIKLQLYTGSKESSTLVGTLTIAPNTKGDDVIMFDDGKSLSVLKPTEGVVE